MRSADGMRRFGAFGRHLTLWVGVCMAVGRKPKGLFAAIFVDWCVKPFSMALLGWLFFKHLFLPQIGAQLADLYIAGVIVLAADLRRLRAREVLQEVCA